MDANAIIIGQNTAIKDLDATPVFHKGQKIASYFETEVKNYKIYNSNSIGWPDPSPGHVTIQKKFLQRQKFWNEQDVKRVINEIRLTIENI